MSQITFDTSAISSPATVSPLTWSHTCTGANRILWVAVSEADGATNTSGVKYNGVSMTQVGTGSVIPGGNAIVTLWYLVNPPAGSNTVSVTFSGSSQHIGASSSYAVANQSGQPDSSHAATGTGVTTLTNSTTTVADNSWLVGAFGDTRTVSGGTATTLRQGNGGFGIMDSNGAKTPAGSYSLIDAGDGSSGNFASVVASFSPGGFTQTVSDSLAMATKDTTSTVYGFFQTYSDSLAMAAKDLVKSVYGWSNTLKSAIENWVNRPKS